MLIGAFGLSVLYMAIYAAVTRTTLVKSSAKDLKVLMTGAELLAMERKRKDREKEKETEKEKEKETGRWKKEWRDVTATEEGKELKGDMTWDNVSDGDSPLGEPISHFVDVDEEPKKAK